MSLVAYGDSDCETDEDNPITADVEKLTAKDDDKTKFTKPFLMLPEPKSIINEKISEDCDSDKEDNSVVTLKRPLVNNIQEKSENCLLFPTLPKPKTSGKVKIIIPSLNEVNI